MSGVPHRCSHCGTRHTFRYQWDTYLRRKRCRCCGGFRFYVDKWMVSRPRSSCRCDGYHFPHRRGSRYCDFYEGELSVEELQSRFRRC